MREKRVLIVVAAAFLLAACDAGVSQQGTPSPVVEQTPVSTLEGTPVQGSIAGTAATPPHDTIGPEDVAHGYVMHVEADLTVPAGGIYQWQGEQGLYRIEGLPPGLYYVNARWAQPGGVDFTGYYCGGTFKQGDVGWETRPPVPIQLGAGQVVGNVDILVGHA
jgi:hypothetical protein